MRAMTASMSSSTEDMGLTFSWRAPALAPTIMCLTGETRKWPCQVFSPQALHKPVDK
jgi:hypothetical protein